MRVERRPCTGSESSVHPSRGGLQNGSLIHGLLDRLRYCVDSGMVADHKGMRMSGAELAGVVYRAAAGLRSRGLHPEDVVAVLAPVSTARLVSVCTALAVGCVALPLQPSSDVDILIKVLVDTDARMILATGELAPLAVRLADCSRVRQVVSFGGAPETTPFADLLRPGPRHSSSGTVPGPHGSGLMDYTVLPDASPRTVCHSPWELIAHFLRLNTGLRLSRGDTVVLENGMTECDRYILAAVALWNGASVLSLADENATVAATALRAHQAVVRGVPLPSRMSLRPA